MLERRASMAAAPAIYPHAIQEWWMLDWAGCVVTQLRSGKTMAPARGSLKYNIT